MFDASEVMFDASDENTHPEASLGRGGGSEGAADGGLGFVGPLVQRVLPELLDAEITEALGVEKCERVPDRLGYGVTILLTLVTRVGKLELR
jgi:transposase-like protein